ncbi:MAG TPA: HAD-IIB family hydrolase [Mariprofundaceae bacterium]|nr:HAD-IIB family hydrolase [Mariprofundaceae bacterium]
MTPSRRFLFASDLDGTLLPNTSTVPPAGCLRRTIAMLESLLSADCPVCYISGRHLSLARKGQEAFFLPKPDYWVCNVGSEIYSRGGRLDRQWSEQLGPAFDHAAMWSLLRDLEGLAPQESVKQGRHKFSLYSVGHPTAEMVQQIISRMPESDRFRVVTSVDEKSDRGLLDILPADAGKAQALAYLMHRLGFTATDTFFSGDSGNDLDALTSGIFGTLVGNTPKNVCIQACQLMQERSASRIHFSEAPYGDGVIEGLQAGGYLALEDG